MKTTTSIKGTCLALALAITGLMGISAKAQNIGQVDFVAMFGHDVNVGPTLDLFGGQVTVSAHTMLDKNQPFVLGAPGSVGSIFVEFDSSPFKGGLGVQTWGPKIEGSKGISGGGGHQNEELIFSYNQGGAFLGSISVIINDLRWGSGIGKDDDPVIWLSTSNGIFGFDEFAIAGAATPNGSDSYTIDFGHWAGIVGGADVVVDGFVVRESNGHTFVRGFNAGVIPEPGSAVLAALGLFTLIIRGRRRGVLSFSA